MKTVNIGALLFFCCQQAYKEVYVWLCKTLSAWICKEETLGHCILYFTFLPGVSESQTLPKRFSLAVQDICNGWCLNTLTFQPYARTYP